MSKLLQKHLNRQKKDVYQEINKHLRKLEVNNDKIKELEDEIITYESSIETYSIMFPNWEDLKGVDDNLYSEINGFLRLISLTENQIGILKNSNSTLESSVSLLKNKIVSLNVDITWIRGDEDYE